MKRLLPWAVAALLPWRAAYALFRARAARRADDPHARAACACARAHGLDVDEAGFCRRAVLQPLVDQADVALAWVRQRHWYRHWVRVEGDSFPKRGPFLAITFHMGVGIASAPYALGAHERGVFLIYAPWEAAPGDFIGRMRARAWLSILRRRMGAPPVPTGGAFARARAWLAEGGGIMGLIDVPHYGHRRTSAVPFFGRTIGLSNGLAALAAETGAPVYVFTSTLDGDSPRRLLRIHGPLRAREPEALMREIGLWFEDAVRADPAAWHYWGAVDTAFPPPEA
jgi:lauroyl/myristoyl acyltransferase